MHPSRPLAVEHDPKSKKSRLTLNDYHILVTWIEVLKNREKIYGTDNKTKVGDKSRTTRTQGYLEMAAHLNENTVNPNLPTLDRHQLQTRWEWYVKKYYDAVRAQRSTGWGLNDVGAANGVTLEEKLDKLCPLFHRMDNVFGSRANNRPAATLALGALQQIGSSKDVLVTTTQRNSPSGLACLTHQKSSQTSTMRALARMPGNPMEDVRRQRPKKPTTKPEPQ
jgi:hypothetical protein